MMARSDPILIQLGFFAIASQIRYISGFGPSLLGQTSFSLPTDEGGSEYGSASIVLTRSTFLASLFSVVTGGIGTLAIHRAIGLFYGRSFAGAEAAAIFGIGTAVVHMSSAPAAATPSIVSVLAAGSMNVGWAVIVVVVAILFLAHSISAIAVGAVLRSSGHLPRPASLLSLPPLGLWFH